MKGPQLLQNATGVLHTQVGYCAPGSHAVFRGHNLHTGLPLTDWLGLYVFGITGRHPTPAELALLHGMCTLTSYPDTRLWNNRVAALAASARSSPVLGMSAAVAVTEALVYRGGPGIRAIDFFIRAGQALRVGTALRDFVDAELRVRRIYGYGRPINSTDERLPPLAALAKAQGLDGGVHYKLAFEVEAILVTERKPFLKMNYSAATAALAADLGFTPRQYQLFSTFKTLAGAHPCLVEASEKPEGTLFPTPCHGIQYDGVPARVWPAVR